MIKIPIILMSILTMATSFRQCEVNCSKEIKFKISQGKITPLNLIETYVDVVKVASAIRVEYPIRRKWAVIDYVGMFSGTTEYMYDGIVPIEKEEYIKWKKHKGCYIGPICKTNGDCWGNDADKCRTTEATTLVKGRKNFSFRGANWASAFHSTCSMDWECYTTEEIEYPYFKEDGENSIFARVSMFNKEMILHNKSDQWFTINEEEKAYISDNPYQESYRVKVQCIEHEGIKSCDFRKDGDIIIFELNKLGRGYLMNYYFADIKIKEEYNSYQTIQNDNDKPASLNDLMALQTYTNGKISHIAYNQKTFIKQITAIEKVLTGTIYHLTKFNKGIIGDILQRPLSMEIREGRMYLCGCKKSSDYHCIYNTSLASISPLCNNTKRQGEELNIYEIDKIVDIPLSNPNFTGGSESIYESEQDREFKRKTDLDYGNKSQILSGFFGLFGTNGGLFTLVGSIGGWIFIAKCIYGLLYKIT